MRAPLAGTSVGSVALALGTDHFTSVKPAVENPAVFAVDRFFDIGREIVCIGLVLRSIEKWQRRRITTERQERSAQIPLESLEPQDAQIGWQSAINLEPGLQTSRQPAVI